MSNVKRIIKVVIGKTGLDGHWRGVQVVAAALKNAGMEVVYAGMLTADAVIRIAIQEDADVIGLNVGASYEQVRELTRILHEEHMEDVLLIVGGTIPLVDAPELKKMGVNEVFPPGSKLDDIVKFVQENVRKIR